MTCPIKFNISLTNTFIYSFDIDGNGTINMNEFLVKLRVSLI